MFVFVTCAGVVIGTAEVDSLPGLVHARLRPAPAYVAVSLTARRLAAQLAGTQYASPSDGDFAGVMAGRWESVRLALEDEMGRELSADNVVLLEGLPGDAPGVVRLVADFRPGLARFGAAVRPREADGGNRTAA
jgi:hypothetical protein